MIVNNTYEPKIGDVVYKHEFYTDYINEYRSRLDRPGVTQSYEYDLDAFIIYKRVGEPEEHNYRCIKVNKEICPEFSSTLKPKPCRNCKYIERVNKYHLDNLDYYYCTRKEIKIFDPVVTTCEKHEEGNE